MSDPALISSWLWSWLEPVRPALMQLLSALPSTLQHLVLRSEASDWFLLFWVPLFSVLAAIEAWHLRKTKIYALRDAMASINLGTTYLLLDVVWVVVLVVPAMQWVYEHRLLTFEMTAWRFVGLYLGVEFCFYWFHRASHRIRWFWCAHVVHHGSEHMNFTTASRQSWLYSFAGNWLFYTPMVWLGFAPRWVLLALSINLVYQFFLHTQWIHKLPAWFEWVFNTPSHHRAHHGRNPQYLDRNYGGTLIVFDRLFGTFAPEVEAVDYGLVRQVHSYNIVWLNLHEWVDMIRDMSRSAPWSVRLKHLWGPPEWQPQDNPIHACPKSAQAVQRTAAKHPSV